MNKAGVDRIEGVLIATVNPDGSLSNVRVKEITPGSMRNVSVRTFNNSFSDGKCRTEKHDSAYDVEIPFLFRLD